MADDHRVFFAHRFALANNLQKVYNHGMLRTLVVDDEPSIRQLLRSLLTSAGHQVATAASGGEALNVLEDTLPLDLMVVDVCLGDMSGLDVIRSSQLTRPGLRIIAISGYIGLDSFELRRALGREGVSRALPKPFAAQDLLAAVREALMEELPRA